MQTSHQARKPQATAWIFAAVAGIPSIGWFNQHAMAGNPIKVNGGNVPPGVTTMETVRISPDSTRVYYIADQNVDEQYELFSAPLTGGTAIKLNGALVAGADVIPQGFTPNSSRVIYTADQNVGEGFELFSVPS